MAIRNNQGQTVVEYILLLTVAISLVLTFYNSAAFRRLFGNQGVVGTRIKQENEFSYRHAFVRNKPVDVSTNNRDISQHPSYHDPNNGGTRFFGPKDTYE